MIILPIDITTLAVYSTLQALCQTGKLIDCEILGQSAFGYGNTFCGYASWAVPYMILTRGKITWEQYDGNKWRMIKLFDNKRWNPKEDNLLKISKKAGKRMPYKRVNINEYKETKYIINSVNAGWPAIMFTSLAPGTCHVIPVIGYTYLNSELWLVMVETGGFRGSSIMKWGYINEIGKKEINSIGILKPNYQRARAGIYLMKASHLFDLHYKSNEYKYLDYGFIKPWALNSQGKLKQYWHGLSFVHEGV